MFISASILSILSGSKHMLYLGTSGYSYDDWVGPFYPKGLPKHDFLPHYTRFFNCVEVNYTHYAQPTQATMQGMVDRTAPDFRFAVKSFKDMTLGRSQDPVLYREYRYGIEPLVKSGKLGCILLQFPNRFSLSKPNVNHLAFIREQWPELPLVVEFRHASWIEDARTFDFLRDQQMGFCCVDQPQIEGLLPPVVELTSSLAYARFHGRNAEQWYQSDHAWERYNYRYTEAELREWVPRVKDLQAKAQDVYVFFNNHYGANAVTNAQQFAELLGN